MISTLLIILIITVMALVMGVGFFVYLELNISEIPVQTFA